MVRLNLSKEEFSEQTVLTLLTGKGLKFFISCAVL